MSDWSPEKYLLFKQQRTQPAIDLASRVRDCNPKTVLDIGCGPGNSTAVLKSVFPLSKIYGIDNSESMIIKAKELYPDIEFSVCSAENLTGTYDLLFSNACLQWIPNHEKLIPHLMDCLNANGILAVQMPMNQDEPLFRIIKEVTSSPKWDFKDAFFEKNDTLSQNDYFRILSLVSGSFDMWETVYYHVLPSHEQLIAWVRETRLRPYLNMLNEDRKSEFENDILSKAIKAYPLTSTGEVIFKFRRFFFIAHK